jgi:hypothetical protein
VRSADGYLTLFGVIGTNMQRELFVALQLEVVHHFIERFASGRIEGLESPATFGAPKTPKTLLLNPSQLPAHGRPCRCDAEVYTRQFWMVCRDSYIHEKVFVCRERLIPEVSFEVSAIALSGHFRAILARNSREAKVGYPTEPSCLSLPRTSPC